MSGRDHTAATRRVVTPLCGSRGLAPLRKRLQFTASTGYPGSTHGIKGAKDFNFRRRHPEFTTNRRFFVYLL